MNLLFDVALASAYNSPSQKVRVLSEAWVLENLYCLACNAKRLQQTVSNTKCLDFICSNCLHKYELKSFVTRPTKSLIDGAYQSMLECMLSDSRPALILLQRNEEFEVQNVSVIHPAFMTRSLIEARKPLSKKARRAGWIGCNIRLDRLAPDGEIFIVARREVRGRNEVREKYRNLASLEKLPLSERGWTSLTLAIARRLGSASFELKDIYRYEQEFKDVYPSNNNIQAKIRQQLQRLRDRGIIRFVGRGRCEFANRIQREN